MDNPFEAFDLDPRVGIDAITQRLKELIEDAATDAERERIRAAWEELTLHPARRLRAALGAHPETRPPLGAPPSLPRQRAPSTDAEPAPIALGDLAARPSVIATLGEAGRSMPSLPLGLDDDPVL